MKQGEGRKGPRPAELLRARRLGSAAAAADALDDDMYFSLTPMPEGFTTTTTTTPPTITVDSGFRLIESEDWYVTPSIDTGDMGYEWTIRELQL